MNSDRKQNSFIKFIDNIWYHYKFIILIGIAAFIMLSFAMCQMIKKVSPDIFIYHITSQGLTAVSKDEFTDSLGEIADDYNGDGKVKVDLKEEVYALSPTNVVRPNEISPTDSFNLELAHGECMIYIMDKTFYEGNKQFMEDLDVIFGYIPEKSVDNKAFILSDLAVYRKYPVLHEFSEDSYICLRKKRVGVFGMDSESYSHHIDFFKKLIEYKNQE